MKLRLRLLYIILRNEFKELLILLKNLTRRKKLKSKDFQSYLELNETLWNKKNDFQKNKTLINLYYPNPSYTIPNIILGKYLEELYNYECVALLKENDYLSLKLLKSFKIKKYIILKNQNFLNRIKYTFQALKILKNINTIKDLLNFKKYKIDFGKIIYDHYIRNECVGTINHIDEKFVLILSKALYNYELSQNFFSKHKFEYFIQSEKHWVPANIFFQNALLKNIKILSRIGNKNNFGVRLYKDYLKNYLNKNKISNTLFENFIKNKEINNQLFEISNDLINERFGEYSSKKINLDLKVSFCDFYKLDSKKPIVCIFSNNIIDGIFSNEWSIFKDNMTWLKSLIKEIKLIDDVNWLIKSHPSETVNRKMIRTLDVINSLEYNKKNNIIFVDDNSKFKDQIHQIINVAISAHGSVAMEYPAIGIPCVIAGDAFCSGKGFTIEPKNVDEYFKIIKDIKNIQFLDDATIYKARIFWAIYERGIKSTMNIFPNNLQEKKNIWPILTDKILNYKNNLNKNNDLNIFQKNLKFQIDNQNRHLINDKFV